MELRDWLLVAGGALVVLYLAAIAALFVAGRRGDARAVAGFVPDCLVLFRRLLGDRRLRRHDRWLVGALVAYLALPIDLVPDVLPVVGQLDDAILVVLVLRRVLRSAGPSLLEEHWPGPASSAAVLRRLAFGPGPG